MILNGNFQALYVQGQRIAMCKSNDFAAKLAFDDITTKDSGGNKEVLPTMKECNCNMDGIVTSSLLNKLQFPEVLSNGIWVKDAAITVANVTDPNGQELANLVTWGSATIIQQNITGTYDVNTNFVFSIYVKGTGTLTIELGDNIDSAVYPTITATGAWTRYELDYQCISGLDVFAKINKLTGTAISLAFPQLEISDTSTATPYKGSQTTLKMLQTLVDNKTKVQIVQSSYIDNDMKISYDGFISDLQINASNDTAETFTCTFEGTAAQTVTTI